ncbi:MAG: hypothetical protein EOP50_10850, partial [Sphingobacteriales bacterium]
MSFLRNWTYLVKKNADNTETETLVTATTYMSDGAKGWLNSRSPEVIGFPLQPGRYYIKVASFTNSTAQRQAIDVNANVRYTSSSQCSVAAPATTIVSQPTCATATGGFAITNYSSANTYTIIPDAGITQSGGSITAPPGSYTVTANDGVCTSSPSAALVISAQPATPDVPLPGAVTQPGCASATGSFAITNYSSTNSYTVSPNAGVSQSGGTFTAPAGTYTITSSSNGCTSAASANVIINTPPLAPATPLTGNLTQPTCTTATGGFLITNYSSANTYTVSPDAGITQSGGSITAPPGIYTVTAMANGCNSAASTNVVIDAQPGAPAIPVAGAVTQPTCLTATGSFIITNYNPANSYTINPSAGVTQTGSNITAPAGTYAISATVNGCTSAPSTDVVINTQPIAPAAPMTGTITHATCGITTGSFSITNYSSANTYTISPNAGVTQSGTGITAPPGTYTITATAGGCASPSSASVTINTAQNVTATVIDLRTGIDNTTGQQIPDGQIDPDWTTYDVNGNPIGNSFAKVIARPFTFYSAQNA